MYCYYIRSGITTNYRECYDYSKKTIITRFCKLMASKWSYFVKNLNSRPKSKNVFWSPLKTRSTKKIFITKCISKGPSTNNFCHTYQILSSLPLPVCRGQNSSQLLIKTGSIYHLADSWCQSFRSKQLIFVKWLSIVLFNSSKQLPTVVMVKLSWLICWFAVLKVIGVLNWDGFLIFKTELFAYGM